MHSKGTKRDNKFAEPLDCLDREVLMQHCIVAQVDSTGANIDVNVSICKCNAFFIALH